MSASAEGYGPTIQVSVAGRAWTLHRASDFDSLWDSMTEGDNPDEWEDHIPYWTELWPSSIALSEWLVSRSGEIQGRRCLDLGCGLGLVSLVAQSLGASVIGVDIEAEALRYARINADANGVSQPLWAAMDWRRPAVPAGSINCVWGGDIMYERRFVAPVLSFFEHVLAPGGKAWMAEPGRAVYDAFLQGLAGGGWHGRRVFSRSVDALYAQSVPVNVTVWEITRAGR